MTEDQLREQMRRVDELTPPATNFDERALYAGQRLVARRRTWSTGLLGAAAAVVVGSLVVVNINQPNSTSSGSSVAGDAPGRGATKPLAPAAGDSRSGPGQGEGNSGSGSTAVPGIPGASPSTITPSAGSPNFAFGSNGVPAALAAVNSVLARPPYDEIYSGTRLVNTPTSEVRYYFTRLDPAAMAVVTGGLPAGAPIVFIQSAYSAKACAITLGGVDADVPTLKRQGFPIMKVGCDELGRVAFALGPTATESQRASLRATYGDVVTVTDENGLPAADGR